MEKILDPSGLKSAEIFHFLEISPANRIILTDYWSMETFKRVFYAQDSFRKLAPFAEQILVLQNTFSISRLRPRSKGLLSRLIDEEQTRDMRKYCHAITSNDPGITQDILRKHGKAHAFLEQIETAAPSLHGAMLEMIKTIPVADRDALRLGKITDGLISHSTGWIAKLTQMQFRGFKGGPAMPKAGDVIFSLQFRYTVCTYVMLIKWVSEGGLEGRQIDRFKNDMTDMTYVAMATFFDGLITQDTRQRQVYQLAQAFLRGAFGVQGRAWIALG